MARDINYHKVVGEPFEPWVSQQILDRQRIFSSGLNSTRSAQQIQYLNGRSSWVKVGSGVDVGRFERLTRIGIENPFPYQSENLAKSFVLWNTLPSNNITLDAIDDTGANYEYNVHSSLRRAGVARYNSLINNFTYGFGGTEFGIQPPPGIISFNVSHLNRGSIRKGYLMLKAYNKFQLDLIDLLYLRLGFSILVEFGHSHYLNGNTPTLMGNTILDSDSFFNTPNLINSNGSNHLAILQQIRNTQQTYFGSYDAIFGKVSNFDWSLSDDGTYDITIHLTSLGDVVESLKINTLPGRNQISPTNEDTIEEENDPKLNRDAITNWLYCLQKLEDDEKQAKFNESTDLAYYHPESNPNQVQVAGSPYGTRDWSTKHYVRLGRLLTFLKTDIIPYFNTNSGEYPICDIDDFSDLRCNYSSPPNSPIISFDPSVCLIKPDLDAIKGLGVGRAEYVSWLDSQLEDFINPNGGDTGNILNIYLEFNFVQSLLLQNIDVENEGKVTLFNFLQEICNGINLSLGFMVQLEPTIDEERNYIVIRDQKITPTINNPAIPNTPSISPAIEIYGIRENSSSFVKKFSFKTNISNKIATTISIGATAANESLTEEATAFQKWNIGLIDRFKLGTRDGKENLVNDDFTCGPTELKSGSNGLITRITGFFNLVKGNVERVAEALTSSYKESLATRIRLQNENYIYNLALVLGINNQTQFSLRIENNITLTDSVKKGNYFTEEGINFTQRLHQLWVTNFLQNQSSLSNNPKETNSNNIGFIPVDLELTLDGLSGIRIYNQLRVKTDLLPNNYPDVLEFIVKSVKQDIQNNEWTTIVSCIAKPKSTEDALS